MTQSHIEDKGNLKQFFSCFYVPRHEDVWGNGNKAPRFLDPITNDGSETQGPVALFLQMNPTELLKRKLDVVNKIKISAGNRT